MKKTLLSLLPFLVLFCGMTQAGSVDHRPAFDKSAYKGTLWTQVNPWWNPNKPRTGMPQGGPNYARKVYPDEPVKYWKEAMAECKAKGMTGWQFELVINSPGFADILKQTIQAAEEIGDFKLSLFLGMFRPKKGPEGVDIAIKQLFAQFDMFAEEFKNSDVFYRLDGRPVLNIYTSWDYTPEEWVKIQEAFENRYGRCIWLANLWWGTYTPDNKQAELRKYMPYFDGCTAYANWNSQDKLYKLVGEVMHREFPQKIFEGSVTNTYSVHYTHAGTFTYAGRKFRASWDSMLANKPDSIVMTNLFDHWENSLILPCYEREDFILRYGQFQMQELYGHKAPLKTKPEVVVTSYIDMIAGYRDLLFEVVSFPLDGADKKYSYTLELLDEGGNVLHAFPGQEIMLDKMQVQEFTLPSARFAGRLLIPRLRGTWQGTAQRSLNLPPVWVDPALRSSLMWWARSTTNAIYGDNDDCTWELNGVAPGGIVDWNSTDGIGFARASVNSERITRIRVLRNGEEIASIPEKGMNRSIQFTLPFPALNDDYYWLEGENANGDRITTRPVWVTANIHSGGVKSVVPDGKGGFMDVTIPYGRVPVFYYPCSFNSGSKLLDMGGLQHNGKYNRKSVAYAFGTPLRTGYRHFQNDNKTTGGESIFRQDEQGMGYLRFNGTDDFYIIGGGGVFPYSSTYELSIRPAEIGSKMGVIGTVNAALNISLDEAGFLTVSRGMSTEGTGGTAAAKVETVRLKSKSPLKANEWRKIAVVYDCRTLKLYIDGKLHASANGAPNPDHVTLNFMSIGSSLRFLQVPHSFFKGDITQLRFTGRPLSPEEFLK